MTKDLTEAFLSLENFDGITSFYIEEEKLKSAYKGKDFDTDLRDSLRRGELKRGTDGKRIDLNPNKSNFGMCFEQTLDDAKIFFRN